MTDIGFTQNTDGGLVFMTAPNITSVHAFTTRAGGVSTGVYHALNLGQGRGDEPERVRKNYEILSKSLGIDKDDIVWPKQVHGSAVRVVTRGDCGRLFSDTQEEADGLITAEPGVALMVFTADCVPILLHDPVRGVVGAVHAGWRGTTANIIGAAIGKMASEFGCLANNIRAAIGPCISKCCYETGSDVAQAVRRVLGGEAGEFLMPCGDGVKKMTDLKGINKELLIRAGVLCENIAVSDECTSCRSDKYWSHRRTNGIRGSQAAVIALKRNTL